MLSSSIRPVLAVVVVAIDNQVASIAGKVLALPHLIVRITLALAVLSVRQSNFWLDSEVRKTVLAPLNVVFLAVC